jgi:hypothetical protein
MDEWQFKTTAAGWRWQCIDKKTGELVRAGEATFTVLYDCVEDAKRNGFVPRGLKLSSRAPPPARM